MQTNIQINSYMNVMHLNSSVLQFEYVMIKAAPQTNESYQTANKIKDSLKMYNRKRWIDGYHNQPA